MQIIPSNICFSAYKMILYMQKRRLVMRKFDYSFLDNGMLPAGLINTTGGIYSLRTASDVRKE